MRSGAIPRGCGRAARENKEGLPCYRRVGDVLRWRVTTKYRSTKTKANPMTGKPIYITFLHVETEKLWTSSLDVHQPRYSCRRILAIDF
jgi:hypothetical protein